MLSGFDGFCLLFILWLMSPAWIFLILAAVVLVRQALTEGEKR